MTGTAWQAYGPVADLPGARAVATTLRAHGVGRRSVGIVPLHRAVGIEQHPLARWTLAAASRHALRTMVAGIPVLLLAYIGVFAVTLDGDRSTAVVVGLVGAVGAVPIAGLIGFAQGWSRWSPLTVLDDGRLPATGYLVVTASPVDPGVDLPSRWTAGARRAPVGAAGS